jgi:hypothetical protein
LLGGLLRLVVSLAVLFAMWFLEPERQTWDAAWMTGAAAAGVWAAERSHGRRLRAVRLTPQ